MAIELSTVLGIVGRLDDSPGENTSRERFRRFLKAEVKDLGTLRDYTDECLRNSGEQYDRAFQDLVNRLGVELGFEVEEGRYQGVQGEIGFDGLWSSPKGLKIVVEAKKRVDVYVVKTSTLIGYVDNLISHGRIANWNEALGLYVVGLYEQGTSQLENSIVAEGRNRLRVASVESLLSLAELMSEYDVSHEDILSVLKPSGPAIDPIVGIMNRMLVGEPPAEGREKEKLAQLQGTEGEAQYWLTPVRGDQESSAEDVIKKLVGEHGIYAFGDKTPGRSGVKPGDWICFYASGSGVVAHAKISSKPERKPDPRVRNSERYPWTFKVSNAKLYLDKPVSIDASMRQNLDAFSKIDPSRPWGWFVVTTRSMTRNDFMLLTGQSGRPKQ